MNRTCYLLLLIVMVIVLLGKVLVPQALSSSDDIIKQRIEGKAANTPELKEAEVNVAVEDGNVILYGTVVLYIQKMFYEQIAWKTVGVVEVDNEIRVVPQLSQIDSAIERKIMGIVHTHPMFHGTSLKIVVEEGTVSIGGTFEHPRDVLFLKHRVAEIEGVVALNLQANFRI